MDASFDVGGQNKLVGRVTCIPTRCIDPESLSDALMKECGPNGYRVEVRNNTYAIKTRHPLSKVWNLSVVESF